MVYGRFVRSWCATLLLACVATGCLSRGGASATDPLSSTSKPAAGETSPERGEIPTAARGDVVALAVTRLPKFLTVAADRVYWSNGYGELSSVSIDGGEVIVHHKPGAEGALAGVVTSDADSVYFATRRGIYRLVVGARSPTRVVARKDTLSVAVDDRYVYFTVFSKSGIWRVKKGGGVAKRLASSRMAGSLTAAGDYLYWNSYSGGMVHRVRRGGGRRRVVARAHRPTGLAVSGDRVVWSTERRGDVFVKRPHRHKRRLFRGAKNHDVIAADEEYVYFGSWVPKGKGRITRVPLAGGEPELLADELRSPVGMAVWGDALFVANKGEDTILRIEKSSRVR